MPPGRCGRGSTGTSAEVADEIEIVDNPAKHRLEAVHDGHVAELIYRVVGDRLVIVHTGVPDELGGHGLGGRLVQAALDKARREGKTVVVECPFARSWLEKHPDAI